MILLIKLEQKLIKKFLYKRTFSPYLSIYSCQIELYFVLFKQVDYPKFMQFLVIFIIETFYAIGRGAFVFFVAPYFSKSLNISVGWFITLAPILMNLTSIFEI